MAGNRNADTRIPMWLKRAVRATRVKPCHALGAFLLFFSCVYFLHRPLSLLFSAIHPKSASEVLRPGQDAFKHFAGRRECGISQGKLYQPPSYSDPNSAPFCKNRSRFLEAVSSGGRDGVDAPYVGKDCTYQWFSTYEICMILSRFQSIIFLGGNSSADIYTAFNILLREDLALGGLQTSTMSEEEKNDYQCDGQFVNVNCLRYTLQSSDQLSKQNGKEDSMGSAYYCRDTPHVYIPVNDTPAPSHSVNLFKELTHSKPNPWQPTPLIFSFNPSSSLTAPTESIFSIATPLAFNAVEEWLQYSRDAERNIPMLFLTPPATNVRAPSGKRALWEFYEEMVEFGKGKHFDVLGLWNLTNGTEFNEGLALVQAMMVINWLAKVETS